MQHYLVGVVLLWAFLVFTLWRGNPQIGCHQHPLGSSVPCPQPHPPRPRPTASTGKSVQSSTPHFSSPFPSSASPAPVQQPQSQCLPVPIPGSVLPGMQDSSVITTAVRLGTSPLLETPSLTLSRKRSRGTLMKTTSRMDWMMMMASFRVFLLWICWMFL